MPPAAFEPVAVLLRRYLVRICERFGGLTPDGVRALAWWEFAQMCEAVEEWMDRGMR